VSIRNLEFMFKPRSVAVVGASTQPHSVGLTVMRSLLADGFAGPIMPVNPRYKAVAGVLAYPDVLSLPETPDLAILCTPPATIPGLIAELGGRGTRAAVVITAGLDRERDAQGRTLQQAMLEAAKPHLLRILGPNCVGLMIPGLGLNASFAHTNPLPGKIAFVTQSGGMVTAVLDWAKSNGIGFSHFISLGNSADVDFGDILDYLGDDPTTRAILLYIEAIKEARKFMSAARAAARNKPIIAVKAGRVAEGAKAAASHTGALAGADDVYEAALRRAGILRVDTIEALFDAVETLARARSVQGDRLTIMTNGGGPGVMATDALVMSGGRLATLSAATMQRLDNLLPPNWSHGNPVDIIGDAPVERYVQTLKTLLQEPDTGAVLFIHAPVAIVSSEEVARAVVPVIRDTQRNVLACWLGRDGVAAARRIFAEANIPTYDTPEDAVGAFMQMVNYRRNQELLMETPPSTPEEFTPRVEAARTVIAQALADGREMLTEPEAKAILVAYDIPTVETRVAETPAECGRLALEMKRPLAVKIVSPDLTHKSDVGGVALNLETPEEAYAVAESMLKRLKVHHPGARLTGFSVQEMARRPGAHELIIGAVTDPIFGPVILFGQGGTAVEIIGDRAVALPPLNLTLARELVSRTRISRLLAGYRDRPPADLNGIYLTLMKVAQMLADLPEISELDINPLFADEQGVLAVDARMRVQPALRPGAARLAIRPYPQELEEEIIFESRQTLVRPIRPEDEPQYREFFGRLDPEDVYLRFFAYKRELVHSQLARFTQIDFDREMAFIATRKNESGELEILGVVSSVTDSDNRWAELAIIVRSDLKGKGLGRTLLNKIIRYCRNRGTEILRGEVLRSNVAMLALAKKLGFELQSSEDEEMVVVRLNLQTDDR
jgi:acetyltransferase